MSQGSKGAEDPYDEASQDDGNRPVFATPSPPNENTEGVARIGSLNSLEGEFLLSTEDMALERGESPASSTPSPPMFLNNVNSNSIPEEKHAQQDHGRPPLLPFRSKSSNNCTKATGETLPKPLPVHNRASSTGDQSFMSALTDTDEYGGETNLLQQPVLTPTSQQSSNSRKEQHARKLTLDDLKIASPLETEAEAAIMGELEKRQAAEGNVAGLVLPEVPDDAVDMFQPAKGSRRNLAQDLANVKHAPQRQSLTRGHTQRIIEPMETRDEALASDAFATNKNVNVQETLFDLTGQIHEVQEVAVEKEEVDNVKIEGLNATNRVLLGTDEPETELDTLAKNANVLFRRPTSLETSESDAESDVEAQSTAGQEKKGFWFFRRRVKHQKKSDAPVPDDLEVDLGVAVAGDEEDPNRRDSRRKSVWQKATSPVSTAGMTVAKVGEGVHHFHDFLKPRKLTMRRYSVTVLQWIFLPTLIVSVSLYYANNPLLCQVGCASFSWLFLFLFIRQIVTLTLAKFTEMFIIDFLCLRNRLIARVVGAKVTLLIVQSKGWPFTLMAWAIWDFILLYGSGRFANHWLYYQYVIDVFNENNPSGGITDSEVYTNILIVAVVVSAAVAVKRLWMGIYLGARTYKRYGKQLAAVMNDMLLISLLAALGYDVASQEECIFKWDDMKSDSELEADSKSVDTATKSPPHSRRKSTMSSRGSARNVAPGSHLEDPSRSPASPKVDALSIDSDVLPQLQSSRRMSQKLKINQMLGEWDEPRTVTHQLRDTSISAILQFRQALSYMDDAYPFSVFFGPARTRELCVESSQNLYEKLMMKTPDQVNLPFKTIALIATNEDGSINQHRLKRLYRLFRPDADGTLTLLDFVKSCDKVYKDLRTLRASIENSSQIGKAFESLFNAVFYVVLAFVVLPILGVDPMALILALSGLIVGFAFMIGPASASYFQGILFIVLQKPYDIGDRIHVSQCDNDTNTDGSPCWFVEKVDLYSTTVRFATTNEVATISNGALAKSRIINAARSPQAIISIRLKFGIDVDFTAVDVFQKSVESFVKARKREWLAMIGFRVTRIEADLGFVEYILILQHTSSWQDVGSILRNKAEVANYCLEVAKRLQMRYEAPPLPVKLDLAKAESARQALSGSGLNASGDVDAT